MPPIEFQLPSDNGKTFQIFNFINNEFVPPTNGNYFHDISPSTGIAIAEIPDSSSEDIDAAVVAASAAFKGWSVTSAQTRASFLEAIANEIDKNIEVLARMESIDAGKTYSMALNVDMARSRDNFRFFARQLLHDSDMKTFHMHDAINYTSRVPIGIAGLIVPWNLPL